MTELKIMPVEQCGAVGKCQSSPSGYTSYLKASYRYSEPSEVRVAEYALQQLADARQKDEEAHARNLPAIENNKAVAAAIEALMNGIGMPRSYSERDLKSRSRYPKTITMKAGYLGDIQRHVMVTDHFEIATRTYQELLKRYTEFQKLATEKAERAQRERDQAAERERQARLANVELAEIILRYGMDREFDWRDVLDALCDQHQRADLAVAMMRVRHDWSDGPDAVSNAIDRFKIETDEDKEIANSVLRNLGEGWDGDGRCFRDCSWNYDRLIASLPEQLGADINIAWRRSQRDE